MSQALCPYCGPSEGRCVVAGGGRFFMECRSCARFVEERQGQVDELFIERAYEAPLCIVTPDFIGNDAYKAPPMEDDPFENIGFITAFSTWSLEQTPLFTATSTSFSGQLAELERILSDSLCPGGASLTSTISEGATMSTMLVDYLKAYFHIVELSSLLDLERDTCDNAIQLVGNYLSTIFVKNRNLEGLAAAALLQAAREAHEAPSLQEFSVAANVPQNLIAKHGKALTDTLKITVPAHSTSVHMPRFCNILQLSEKIQDLATHIGDVALSKSYFTRRNPISISAAAIYMSCQLEDKKKTQTEICKATGLTEVTLRKVYKELMEDLWLLLPSDYTPVVPLDKAFPGTAAALGRLNGARGGPGIAGSGPSRPTTPYNSTVTNNSAGLAGDTSNGVAGPSATTSAQSRVASMSTMERPTGATTMRAPLVGDARNRDAVYSMPNASISIFPGGDARGSTRLEEVTDNDRDNAERAKENEREQGSDYGSLRNINMIPATSVPGFPPSFYPFAHFDPRVFQEMNHGMWPPLQLYGTPAMRPEEGSTSMRGNDRTREDGLLNAPLPTSNTPHKFLNLHPGMPNVPSPAMQVKVLPPSMQPRPSDAAGERHIMLGREPTGKGDPEIERGGEAESRGHPPAAPNSAAPLQAFAAGPLFPGFAPGIWPFVNPGGAGPYGVYPPQLVAAQGSLPPTFGIGGDAHPGVQEKGLEGLPQGLLASASAETMARMAGTGIAGGQALGLGGQPSHPTHLGIPWAGAQFHPLFLPATMNVGSIPTGGHTGAGISDATLTRKRDGGGAGVDAGPGGTPSGATMKPPQLPDRFPILGPGASRVHSSLPSGPGSTGPHANLSQRPQGAEASGTSGVMVNKTSR